MPQCNRGWWCHKGGRGDGDWIGEGETLRQERDDDLCDVRVCASVKATVSLK